jgi:hypothetical protein
VEGVSGNDDHERRYNLDKQFVPGRHGLEVVKKPGNKDQNHGGQGKQEGQADHGAGVKPGRKPGDNKGYDKTGADKRRGKPDSPQTGNIAGVYLPVVNTIVPGFFMGENKDPGNHNTGNDKRGANHTTENKRHVKPFHKPSQSVTVFPQYPPMLFFDITRKMKNCPAPAGHTQACIEEADKAEYTA